MLRGFDPWQLVGKQLQVNGYKDQLSDGFIVSSIQSVPEMMDVKEGGVRGPQSTLVVLCTFLDVTDEPESPAYFENMFDDQFLGFDHYWQELSYGAIANGPV